MNATRANYLAVFLFVILLTGHSPQSWAASCCGGGSSLPQLITGDFKATFSSSASHSSVIGDVDEKSESTFRHDKNLERSQTVKLDGAYLLSDYWQAGASLPLVRHTRALGDHSYESSGLGDVQAQIANEFLPETTFSKWTPRGFAFLSLTAPTAPSIYDFQGELAEDARGRGFWTPSLGFALLKTRGRWDFLLSAEGHQSLSREFTSKSGDKFTVAPTIGGSALVSAGWSPSASSPWRASLGVSPKFEGPKHLSRGAVSSEQLVWDTILGANYLIDKEYSASFSYDDQTILGPAYNTTLGRTVSVQLQKRWSL